MWLGGEDFEVLAGEFGVGDGEELLLDFGLGGEVGVAEDGGRGGLGGILRGDESGEKERQEKEHRSWFLLCHVENPSERSGVDEEGKSGLRTV